MKRIDGTAIAQKIHEETKQRIDALSSRGIRPGLAVVLVGDDPASRAYVRSKRQKGRRAWSALGETRTRRHGLAGRSRRARARVECRSRRAGILVQSPPAQSHQRSRLIVEAIDPRKDVDGFHPVNVAKLALDAQPGFVPCTPLGCVQLIEESGFDTAGR